MALLRSSRSAARNADRILSANGNSANVLAISLPEIEM
jgi:hypothetical protein